MKNRIFAFLLAVLLLPGLAQAKIFLEDTNDTLQVVTASGVTTIHMYASWADLTTTALTPGSSTARVTSATTTTLVASPGASTQRQIKGFSIRNNHASSSNAITVQFYDGTNATELIKYTLLAGETLQWGEDESFRVIDASGQVKGLVSATQSGTWNITNISGTISLPTGAATAANQDGIIKDGTGDTTQANVTNGNLSTNIARMNDVAVSMGVGASGTGTQRVAALIHDGTRTAQVTTTGGGSVQMECTAGCSGGTQYDEDTAHVSGDKLTLAGAVRQDSDAALAADGDRSVLQVDATGFLKVINKNPNLAADNSTNSTAKAPVLPGTVSTSAPTWTNGNQSALSLQTDGSVRAAITNTPTVTANAGTNLNTSALLTTSAHDAAFGTAGSADTQVRTVQGIASMTPLLVNPGTATNFGIYAEDAAETAGANLSMAGSVRRDTAASSAGSTGDNATINTDANGKLWTNADLTAIAGTTISTGNGASGTGVQRVTIANDSTGVLATINSLTQMNGQTIAMGTGTRSAGTQRVTIATDDVVPASQSGTWTVQPGNTANTTPWLTSSIPATSGGTSVCYITSAASTNATNCKASAGQLYGFDLVNTTGTIYYLRLYNLSSSPTCSSATGFVRTIPIPASTTGAGIARSIPVGEAYGTGLGFCLTGGGSSTDNTNAATGVYVTLNYK